MPTTILAEEPATSQPVLSQGRGLKRVQPEPVPHPLVPSSSKSLKSFIQSQATGVTSSSQSDIQDSEIDEEDKQEDDECLPLGQNFSAFVNK